MKKYRSMLLILAAFLMSTGIFAPIDSYAKPPSSRTVKLSGKKKSKIVTKKSRKKPALAKNVTKTKAISVLREHLPEYADLHETKLRGAVDVYVPLPENFDFRSPFAIPRLRAELIQNIDDWLGTRYRYGGTSKRGVDCSGFTSVIVTETLNWSFHGSSRIMAERFNPIFDVDSLQFGDLVFFSGRGRRSQRIGHVGIYIGNGVFAHSSTGRGVLYSHLTEGYYTERFRWGGRFVTTPLAATNIPRVYTYQ